MNFYLLFYLLAAGVFGIVMLCVDKYKATHSKWRVKESTLHLFELFGGVFLMLPAMYVVRHKNRKSSFYLITYSILVVWIVGLYFVLR